MRAEPPHSVLSNLDAPEGLSGSLSRPLALLRGELAALCSRLCLPKAHVLYRRETWCGPQPSCLPAILLGCAFGHRENQVKVLGLLQMVTGLEPTDRCSMGAYDSAGVTRDSGWLHLGPVPCFLGSFLSGEGPRVPQRFCGCPKCSLCVLAGSLEDHEKSTVLGVWGPVSMLMLSRGGCMSLAIADPSPLPGPSVCSCKVRIGLTAA